MTILLKLINIKFKYFQKIIKQMKRLQSSDIQVSKQDQANINLFSKLYSKNQDMQSLLNSTQQKINQHKDTLDEIELNDDEDMVRYRFGSCFFMMTTERARDLVQRDIKKLEEEKVNFDKELDAITKKMKKLKATLYGKFGNSINLDQ